MCESLAGDRERRQRKGVCLVEEMVFEVVVKVEGLQVGNWRVCCGGYFTAAAKAVLNFGLGADLGAM